MIKVNINGNDGSVSMSICGDLNTISAEITMIVGLVYRSIKENQGKVAADIFKENVKTTIASDFVFMKQNERDSYIKSVKDKIKNDLDTDDIVDKDIEDIISKPYKPETDNDTGGVE